MLGLNGKLLDFIYPVGSYYETSDISFNPNTAWGGTWVEDTKGRVTVALDSDDTNFDTINETGGEKEHFQTLDECYWDNTGQNPSAPAGGFGGYLVTHVDEIQKGSNVLQPYVVVKRWHRTA